MAKTLRLLLLLGIVLCSLIALSSWSQQPMPGAKVATLKPAPVHGAYALLPYPHRVEARLSDQTALKCFARTHRGTTADAQLLTGASNGGQQTTNNCLPRDPEAHCDTLHQDLVGAFYA